jgi:hypothetical protein
MFVVFSVKGKVSITDVRFEFFTVVKIQIEVFWVVTPCSVAVG